MEFERWLITHHCTFINQVNCIAFITSHITLTRTKHTSHNIDNTSMLGGGGLEGEPGGKRCWLGMQNDAAAAAASSFAVSSSAAVANRFHPSRVTHHTTHRTHHTSHITNHCTLHTVHSTQRTSHNTQHTTHIIPDTSLKNTKHTCAALRRLLLLLHFAVHQTLARPA